MLGVVGMGQLKSSRWNSGEWCGLAMACEYLIRASPQHLRPASLREYGNLPKGEDGRVRDEQVDPRTRNYHALTEVPPADDEMEYEP